MLTVNQEYTQVGVSKIDNIYSIGVGRDCIFYLTNCTYSVYISTPKNMQNLQPGISCLVHLKSLN